MVRDLKFVDIKLRLLGRWARSPHSQFSYLLETEIHRKGYLTNYSKSAGMGDVPRQSVFSCFPAR
jgi:hypothetical protein